MIKRADQEPGFWCEWEAPKDRIVEAIQFPISDKSWPERMISAYYSIESDKRKNKLTVTA